MRGLLSVFSLGMDELGRKLADQGLDVDVVPASLSSFVVGNIKDFYHRHPRYGPIVIVAHSLGGTYAPALARQFQEAGLPVELLIVMDTRHQLTIPANVKRCVNFYQSGEHSFIRGSPLVRASESTELVNVDVATYPLEGPGGRGSIDHFNIDDSPWLHRVIVGEVLRACPPRKVRTCPRIGS